MDNKITIDFIIEQMKEWIEDKQIIGPDVWLNAAQKLNVLLSDEHDKLFRLQQIVANKRIDFLQEDDKRNVSKAKMYVEASDDYREMKEQEAKCKRVEEFIRLAKIQARLKDSEYRNQM